MNIRYLIMHEMYFGHKNIIDQNLFEYIYMYLNYVTITSKRGIKSNLKISSDRVNYFPSITE